MTAERGVGVGVGVVVLKDGEILLIRRGKAPGAGEWSIPGGRQIRGETVRETAAREVREETGVEIELGPLVDVVDLIAEGHHLTLVDFVARWRTGAPRPGDDAADARFVPLDKLEDYGLWSKTVEVIRRAVALDSP